MHVTCASGSYDGDDALPETDQKMKKKIKYQQRIIEGGTRGEPNETYALSPRTPGLGGPGHLEADISKSADSLFRVMSEHGLNIPEATPTAMTPDSTMTDGVTQSVSPRSTSTTPDTPQTHGDHRVRGDKHFVIRIDNEVARQEKLKKEKFRVGARGMASVSPREVMTQGFIGGGIGSDHEMEAMSEEHENLVTIGLGSPDVQH